MTPLLELFEGGEWSRRQGASDADLDHAEVVLGVQLPDALKAVLRWSDGGKGWIGQGKAYVQLLSVAEIVEYQQHGYCPVTHVLLVGGDGSREHFALDYRADATRPSLVAVDLTNPTNEAVLTFGADFQDGVEQMAAAGDIWSIPHVRDALVES